jgi:hypothetical protein
MRNALCIVMLAGFLASLVSEDVSSECFSFWENGNCSDVMVDCDLHLEPTVEPGEFCGFRTQGYEFQFWDSAQGFDEPGNYTAGWAATNNCFTIFSCVAGDVGENDLQFCNPLSVGIAIPASTNVPCFECGQWEI